MLDRLMLASGASEEKLYVEDVFSTYTYGGSSSTRDINNQVDLLTKGGLVWIKARTSSSASAGHALFDTERGRAYGLATQSSSAQVGPSASGADLDSFLTDGFRVAGNSNNWALNVNGISYTSWTFRKAPKFFDVVTWTGDGSVPKGPVSHSLGSVPGVIIIKSLSNDSSVGNDWIVWHRSAASTTGGTWDNTNNSNWPVALKLNSTDPSTVYNGWLTGISSSTFTPIYHKTSGVTYVAYLFAHDDTANGLIKCGSYSGNGSETGPVVSLGWEPQWLMVKRTDSVGPWFILDSMRGFTADGTREEALLANDVSAEVEGTWAGLNSAGFQLKTTNGNLNASGGTYVYVAIRRGPMKVPTDAATVFQPATQNIGATYAYPIGAFYPFDMMLYQHRKGTVANRVITRIIGDGKRLDTTSTNYEYRGSYPDFYANYPEWTPEGESNGTVTVDGNYVDGSYNYATYKFRRAPGFFDVVCYKGLDTYAQISHNLSVAPELMFIKARDTTGWGWYGIHVTTQRELYLNTTAAGTTANQSVIWGEIPYAPTSTYFKVGPNGALGSSSFDYVAYLFASCPGVSKVGSYTGNGSSQTINCGFTAGARFFLVKRTDSTGDWWVWDTARGIISAADPALALNSRAAEVASADAVDTDSTGIVVNQETTCNINVNGATYIYLAIA